MSHDPEKLAATYIDGMRARSRRRYEAHLLDCEPCWQEVSLGRTGRELAERIRDTTPPTLREDIRATITAAAARPDRPSAGRPLRHAAAFALAATLAILAGIGIWRPWQQTSPGRAVSSPSTLSVAVANFRHDRLPGNTVPTQQAPDLSTLGLHLVGAATGSLDGMDMTVFAYRGDSGSRLDLYRSDQPIPETDEAQELAGGEHAWRTALDGITIICGGDQHTQLLLGTDASLVHHAATMLGLI